MFLQLVFGNVLFAAASDPVERFVRLTTPHETCKSRGFNDIVTKSVCDFAFDTLVDNEVERVTNIAATYLPMGCFSECHSEYSGHHCRKFNKHNRTNSVIAAQARFLCYSDKQEYVRLGKGGSCENEGLHSIDSFEMCEEAFRVLKERGKGMHHIEIVSRKWQPKGCFSTCYDPFDGHTCRTLNTDSVGNGLGTDRNLRMLCEIPGFSTTITTTTTPTTTIAEPPREQIRSVADQEYCTNYVFLPPRDVHSAEACYNRTKTDSRCYNGGKIFSFEKAQKSGICICCSDDGSARTPHPSWSVFSVS
eukprot:TRINITY_DN322_c1_g2_i3.p1 TRINITY_DN322_c1_g2~~TRINITY_DN322_c1_g2_i3.p1  ORF type:complete len:305 (+),score=30.31 TRINITY_DN322_c1_g2_i3:57-971(+)